MKKKLLLLTSLLLLASCNKETLPIVEGNTILYSEIYESSVFQFSENPNTITNDKIENIKNYFISNGSHLSNDTDYIFLFKGKINNKEIKLDLSYDSSKQNNPFYIASTYYQDKAEDRPSRSYFFSCTTDFVHLSEQLENPISYYDYYYLENRIDKQNSFEVEYSNIEVEHHYQIKKADYKIKENENKKGNQNEKDLSIHALEPIRFLFCYIEAFLNNISASYHLVD